MSMSDRGVLIAALFLGCCSLHAQTGRIVGTVRDQSRAIIPNVPVQAVNLATNSVRMAETNNAGDYVLTALPVGAYRVSVEVTGFKKYGPTPSSLPSTRRRAST